MRFEFETLTLDEYGVVTGRQTCAAEQFVEPLSDDVTLEMVAIPEGRFMMGSPSKQGYADEHPQHSVRIGEFWMSKYSITQAQWDAVMDWRPPFRCEGENRPADRISWNDAWAFCARLTMLTGRVYRLPSESEWEYACRAGTTTPFYFGPTITTDVVNYVGEHTYRAEPKGVYRHVTTDVGEFPPNAFGLYDMHGNVWEWCADAWHKDYVDAPNDGRHWEQKDAAYRVLRGGCWHDPPDLCRSAARLKYVPGDGEDYFGFRVALTSIDTGLGAMMNAGGRKRFRWPSLRRFWDRFRSKT